EIEAALVQHPAIAQSVVVASGSGNDVRLIAYVVGRPGQSVVESDLRVHLARTLPDYMVPQRFLAVPALPLTPNGKVDRKALLAFAAPSPEPIAKEARTATALEGELTRAFQAALSIPRMGLDEDFFAAGGHSLVAAQVAALLSEQLGMDVPLRAMFESPTVAKL